MRFQCYIPCSALKPYVKQFVISENAEAQTYKVLPGTSLVMGFQYSGTLAFENGSANVSLATSGITGLLDTYRVFKNSPNIGTVLVMFTETGAANFLRLPLNELFGESIPLNNFFSHNQLAETEERLCAAGTDTERIAIVENLLLARLNPLSPDLLVNKAIETIYQHNGNVRIAELANQLHTSQSPLEKRFRSLVGATPKKFASIIRIKAVMHALKQTNYREVIYRSGYFDQAHFIKDFKSFTGVTPEQYLKDI
ncbi:helix-turn-helix transcriptional regulator [Mucilaginibacter pedocola]|uniref:AraC family transcriptional regulator n=1 Tax=Mucilaginibacter pedocola TaxID=1792845 RepID=A0A1S9PBC9_9SPHI|nr:helix-turn-helix transcriptional regulator [Mucilaginibacter pedocola]OOQ58260.1 AraC family transcriptional regulator [Mucilaginibacter pedocola]